MLRTPQYIYNGWFYSGGGDWVSTSHFESQPIEHPSQTPVLTDGVWVDAWPLATEPANTDLYTGPDVNTGLCRICIDRHGGIPASQAPRKFSFGRPLPGGINMVLVDGHVELAKLEMLWRYYWSHGYVPPATRPR